MGKLEELFKREGKEVPPFPELGVKILQTYLLKPEEEFWKLVEETPELKQFILETANSPRYRKAGPPVTSVRLAILILGDTLAKNLVLGYLSKLLTRQTFTEFNFSLFWARALANLVFATFLSDLIEPFSAHLFPASLLMDYGVIILYLANPQAYLQVLKRRYLDKAIFEAEEEVFGVNHAEVEAEYFEQFSLPRRFILNLRYHHQDPEDFLPPDIHRDLKILRMVNHGVGSFFTHNREERFAKFKEISREFFSEDELEAFKEVFPKVANNFLEVFNLDEHKLLTFSEYEKEKERRIKELEEAQKKEELDLNELLKKYEETRFVFLKEKEELLEKYFRLLERLENLKEKEELLEKCFRLLERLKKESLFDEKTGLYSFPYFMRRLKEELIRARRYVYPFSLLLFDLDVSQKLKEKFGLEGEVEVIKVLGEVINKALRRCDLLSYEGEGRIFVLLPHTPSNGAMVVARKLYRKIEENLKKVFPKYHGPYVVVLSYNPKEINPKRDIPETLLINLIKKGIEVIKKQGKTRISMINLVRDFETS
jgi:diguanylate cyclase (GGDEF)-like protein